MPITNGYATQQQVKDYLRLTSTDATDDGVIDDLVEKASRAIDRFTGRTFYARTETRLYDTPLTRMLWLDDDLLTVTSLTNGDGATISSSDYVFRPANVAPYYALELLGTNGVAWQLSNITNSQRQAISVAGTWGYSATTPEDVELACLILVADTYRKRFSSEGEASGSVTPDGVRILPSAFPFRVRALLTLYRKVV